MNETTSDTGASGVSRGGPRLARIGAGVAAVLGVAAPAFGQVPIVQPGAPGEPSRFISAEEATNLASLRFSAADVKFVQDMLVHHAQALEMTALVDARTTRDTMRRLAERIELSQRDEIAMMESWLREHGIDVPDAAAHHGHDTASMPGMATPEQMAALRQAAGHEFDTLFLELMIEHHRGALEMVEDLLDQPGSAQDPVLFEFTSDVTADQSSEIERMDTMLAGLSPDPRVGLKPGFADAGQASLNMTLVASLPKPPGFFDPEHPAGRPMQRERPRRDDAEADEAEEPADDDVAEPSTDPPADAAAARTPNEGEVQEADADGAEGADDGDKAEPRPSLLSFANTDIVFAGDLLVAGNYHGFNVYDISDPRSPVHVSSVVCPGGQGDVSIVGDLLIYSVEQTRGRLDCGLQGVAGETSSERFRGIRIFDISDVRMPRQVGAVQTCRGSHTHTVVTDPDDDGNVYVYASGTSRVRPGEELEGCSDESPFENPDTALFRIDVIKIPVDDPGNASVVSRPFIFSDPESGVLAGLWEGGDHGPDTQETSRTDQCHDITAFAELGLAAGACSGNGILLDVTDPVNPVRVHEVIDPSFAYWHSATFNNDGTKVIFTDEWGGGSRPRCRASDPKNWGANAIFDIVDGKLEFRSYFKMPAPQTEQENCVAHNGSLVPVPGRDIFVQAWYQGGISVIDFTDSSNPVEIAFFDRGPIDEDDLIMGGYWSAYWHAGYVYATEISRGLDVLALEPSEHLSANEIAAASLARHDAVVNPQQQRKVAWPAEPVVARAYVDQLARTAAITVPQAGAIRAALDRAESALAGEAGGDGVGAADELARIAAFLSSSGGDADEVTRRRRSALVDTLTEIAARLR
ncbi:MAG TPA: DUF305 domain-containing protein [Gammaproteobacteria bacterium]